MTANQHKVILWDFDGVIMNSNSIRDLGFEKVLANYPTEQVDRLMQYHRKNGGLSRYNKFQYFFGHIRKESVVSSDKILKYANRFSEIMLSLLINKDLLIQETINFIKSNSTKINMHIVSGSDQKELRLICKKLCLDQYFISIHGSPKPKNDLVAELIKAHDYSRSECVLIGDSINDYVAAETNGIDFLGYGSNSDVIERSTVNSFL